MSQAPHPFTQIASQGYGDYAATLDDDDQDEHQIEDHTEELEGPESPEPEEHEINELGFTQTQERSYPTGIDSPNEDENEASDNEQEDNDDDEAGPSSPQVDDSNEEQIKHDESENDEDKNQKQSQSRRRVQIMNDSDNDDDEQRPTESNSTVSKEKNRHFLKQFAMKTEDSHKKHKKRRSDEHHHRHDNGSKRFRKTSNDEKAELKEKPTENAEVTSDVEDVVDDIFGKEVDDNEEEVDDREEIAAELEDLNDNEAAQGEEEDEDEDDIQKRTFDTQEENDEERSARKAHNAAAKSNANIMYDIDVFLEQRAEKRRGNRHRGTKNDIDITDSSSDDIASKLVDKMKIATEEDRLFNKRRQPAIAKLLLLPEVEQHLCRADLSETFLEHGILGVFKDWLSPLPDKSLPNIKIRESLIKILQQFGSIDVEYLRDSGIGKALMYLYKHTRESKENKIKLIKIIHDWARPVFKLDTDYTHLTREERQKRDVDQATLKRQTSLTRKPKNRNTDVDLPFADDRRDDEDDDCPRARVPRPSNKDYLIRPVSTAEFPEEKGKDKKRTVSRLEAIKRQQQGRRRDTKPMSIVKLSIEGNKMHL